MVSVSQAFLFSSDGWVGLLMHFVAAGALVVLTGWLYHRKKRMKDAVVGMALGTLAMTLIMIPMNYIFTVHVYGTPKDVVDAIMLPGIIPFNLIKGGEMCIRDRWIPAPFTWVQSIFPCQVDTSMPLVIIKSHRLDKSIDFLRLYLR